MAERTCARCGKPILEPKRKRYCGDACADSARRAQSKLVEAERKSWRRLYRVHDYRNHTDG